MNLSSGARPLALASLLALPPALAAAQEVKVPTPKAIEQCNAEARQAARSPSASPGAPQDGQTSAGRERGSGQAEEKPLPSPEAQRRAERRTAGDPGGPEQERQLEGGDIRVDRGAGEGRVGQPVPGTRAQDVPGSTYSGSLWSNGSSLGMAPEGEGNIAYTDAYRECLRRLGF
jgi:hypothetical protein